MMFCSRELSNVLVLGTDGQQLGYYSCLPIVLAAGVRIFACREYGLQHSRHMRLVERRGAAGAERRFVRPLEILPAGDFVLVPVGVEIPPLEPLKPVSSTTKLGIWQASPSSVNIYITTMEDAGVQQYAAMSDAGQVCQYLSWAFNFLCSGRLIERYGSNGRKYMPEDTLLPAGSYVFTPTGADEPPLKPPPPSFSDLLSPAGWLRRCFDVPAQASPATGAMAHTDVRQPLLTGGKAV